MAGDRGPVACLFSTTPMAIQAADCDTFVLLLGDVDAAASGSGNGMYLVDNRSGEGSLSEGTPRLTTSCSKGSKICWSAAVIVPCSGATASIQSIGNSPAWGFSGQPQPAPDLAGAFTGQAQSASAARAYELVAEMQLETGSLIQPKLTPQILVRGPTAGKRGAALQPQVASIGEEPQAPTRCPDTMIVVALDADRFRASSGASGAFLVDNRVALGSTNEGAANLVTHCNAGDVVAFAVLLINPFDGYTATIAAVNVSGGPIFIAGYAPTASAPSWWNGAPGSCWIGKAILPGTQTYAFTLRLDDGVSPFSATLASPSLICH